MGEFDLIERFFREPARQRPGVDVGIGDDCAIMQLAPGERLAVSSDMLVEGRHFLSTVDPARLGHKSLAVNLSDLAACGARPLGFTLAMALPRADEAWLKGFAAGLFALSDAWACPLIGGDTTQGPLNLCITVFGALPPDQSLLRSAAQVGDDVYISGTVGDARLALEAFRGTVSVSEEAFAHCRSRMEQPSPRVALGQALLACAHAAADISDGLLGDLGHILKASQVGATLDIGFALHTDATSRFLKAQGQERCVAWALSGGDDYELVFTAPPERREAVATAALSSQTPVTRIGQIEAQPGLRLRGPDGQPWLRDYASFDHFQ